MHGFGWRIATFDPNTRTGTVALRDQVLPFDAAATGDDELAAGEPVFVRLFPSAPNAPHVARVWPCLARFRPDPALARSPRYREGAPALDTAVAEGAARALGAMRAPLVPRGVTLGDGRVDVCVVDVWPDAYAIDGVVLDWRGVLHCTGARPVELREVEVAEVRLADDRERAAVHAEDALTAHDIVIAFVEPRDEIAPDRPAAVTLITCTGVAWEAWPADRLESARRERTLAAEHAFAQLEQLRGSPDLAALRPILDTTARLLLAWARWVQAGASPTAETEVPRLYGLVGELDSELTRQRTPKSYAWHVTADLWIAIAYAYGPTPARLCELAARARHLTSEEVDYDLEARRAWCAYVDPFLPSPAGAEVMLDVLIDEAPDTHADTIARLRQIADHPDIPPALRAKARARAGA